MNITKIASQIAANRAEFFRLLEQLEKAVGSAIDETALRGIVDSDFSERQSVTDQEARIILAGCTRSKRKRQAQGESIITH